MADVMESLRRHSIPLSVVLMMLPIAGGGVFAWATVKSAVAMNAKTNEQQEQELEAIKSKQNDAARQRTRIETNQQNIEKLLEKLDQKLDRLD